MVGLYAVCSMYVYVCVVDEKYVECYLTLVTAVEQSLTRDHNQNAYKAAQSSLVV